MADYKITGVTVEIKPGVMLMAEISSPADLKRLLDDLREDGFGIVAATAKGRDAPERLPGMPKDESPVGRIETRAGLPSGTLTSAKVLAFKDENPQLLRPGAFSSVSDATLTLLYAVEIGLNKPSIPYDDFKDLHNAQNIKSGTALPMLLTNLRNAGYVDKKAYAADRTVRLTAKGATKAEEVIKGLCGSQSC
jgi:DNA-binding MarR family transcriptional regulator